MSLDTLKSNFHYHHISFLVAYDNFLAGIIEFAEYIEELKMRTEAYEELEAYKEKAILS